MTQQLVRALPASLALRSPSLGLSPVLAAAWIRRPAAVLPGSRRRRQDVRWSSHSPLGRPAAAPRKKVTLETLRTLYRKNEPITMITAHDFPSAHVADHAGMEMILVGDSLAMVALGMEDTSEVLLEEMILHCRSVSRATKAAFTVSHWNNCMTCPWNI